MAIRFSLVSVTAADKEANFFVGGIPKGFEDLEGWTAFDRFLEDLDEDTEVSVHAESFLYGDDEIFDATPEEVAYMMKRMEMRPDFPLPDVLGFPIQNFCLIGHLMNCFAFLFSNNKKGSLGS